MRAGRNRHYVQIQRPVREQTSTGAEGATSWVTVIRAWVEINSLTMRQRERLVGNQLLADTDSTIRIRWHPLLSAMDATWRVLYKNKIYSLLGAVNVDERNRDIEAQAYVGTNDG